MNVFEMAKTYKNSIPCGNWKLKKIKNDKLKLEFWTTTTEESKSKLPITASNHSNNHNREFKKREFVPSAYFIYNFKVLLFWHAESNTWYNCPFNTKYKAASKSYKNDEQSETDIINIIKQSSIALISLEK